MTNKKILSYLSLLIVSIIWGSGFIATQFAIDSKLSIEGIMTLRFFIGTLCVGIFSRKRLLITSKKTLKHGIIAGAILFVAFYSQTIGQSKTTISNAALITSTNVVIIPFLMWLISKKRPSIRTFILSVITMIGIIILTWQNGERIEFQTGDIIIVLCATTFALHIVFLGIYCKEEPADLITFWQLLAAAIISCLVWLVSPETLKLEQLKNATLPILYLGIFSTFLCYYLQTKAQQNIHPSAAGIILSFEGLFGSLFSIIIGIERFRINVLLGGIIITFCVICMSKESE